MARHAWQRWTLAAVSGVLLTLIYPPFEVSAVAWIALTPLILAVDAARPRAAFALGWFTGTIGVLGVTGWWIFHAAYAYFHLGLAGAAAFTVVATQVFVALYFGLFGVLASLVSGWRLRGVLIPSLFVASEYARAHLLTGNPWELLGHAQRSDALVQLCDLTGVFGLSFVLALSATAVAEVGRSRAPAVLAAVTIVLTWTYGEWRLANLAAAEATVPMLLVQGNLPNDERGRPERFVAHLDRYLALSERADSSRPALIVWPENAIGFFPAENPELLGGITALLRRADTALLTGAPRAGDRPGVAAVYNSAYLFTADGVGGVYDKRKLLPFVEQLLLRPADGPFLAGGTPTIFTLAGTRFGVLICYEAIYPELARDEVQRGARVLINLSNDSWFEAGAGPEQHFQLARFRAIENRVSLVRVTNSGISGVIDPAGREIARLPARTPVAQTVTVPIGSGGSFYSRHGDVFALLCVAVSAGVLLFRVLLRWGLNPSGRVTSRTLHLPRGR